MFECSLELNRQSDERTSSLRDTGYEYWVGSKVADAIHDSCSIFVGTIKEIVGPLKFTGDSDDPRNKYYILKMTVGEWLYGEQKRWGKELILDQATFYMGLVYGSEYPGSNWYKVKLEVAKSYC